jgi:hypothetical protein
MGRARALILQKGYYVAATARLSAASFANLPDKSRAISLLPESRQDRRRISLYRAARDGVHVLQHPTGKVVAEIKVTALLPRLDGTET